MAKGDSSKVWSIFSLVAALGGAAAARQAIDKSWKISTGKQPPENPADPDVDLWEAVAWAATTGAAGAGGWQGAAAGTAAQADACRGRHRARPL